MLPGGMPGAKNLDEHEGVRAALVRHAEQQKLIGAICAAPMVLGHLGLLRGKRATCYPGFETELEGATIHRRALHRRRQYHHGQGSRRIVRLRLPTA